MGNSCACVLYKFIIYTTLHSVTVIAEVWCADAAGNGLGSVTREWSITRLPESRAADGRHATDSTLAAGQHQIWPSTYSRLTYCGRRWYQDLTDWLTASCDRASWVCRRRHQAMNQCSPRHVHYIGIPATVRQNHRHGNNFSAGEAKIGEKRSRQSIKFKV